MNELTALFSVVPVSETTIYGALGIKA